MEPADLLSLLWCWAWGEPISLRNQLAWAAGLGLLLLILTWPPAQIPLALSWTGPGPLPERILVGDRVVFPEPGSSELMERHPGCRQLYCSLGSVEDGQRITVISDGKVVARTIHGWHIARVAISTTSQAPGSKPPTGSPRIRNSGACLGQSR